jgi:hypothetical protein
MCRDRILNRGLTFARRAAALALLLIAMLVAATPSRAQGWHGGWGGWHGGCCGWHSGVFFGFGGFWPFYPYYAPYYYPPYYYPPTYYAPPAYYTPPAAVAPPATVQPQANCREGLWRHSDGSVVNGTACQRPDGTWELTQ